MKFLRRYTLYIAWFNLETKAIGILRRMGMVLQGAVFAAPALAFFFILFNDFATATPLYVNRQIPRGNVQRTYVAGYFDGDETKASNLMLRNLASRDLEENDTVSRSAYRIRPHTGDTLQVDFKKGLFGVAYIDSFTIRKKLASR